MHLLARFLQRGLVAALQCSPGSIERALEFVEVFARRRLPLLHRDTAGSRWGRRSYRFRVVRGDNTENGGQNDCDDDACRHDDPQCAV
jgi:hypothetical protein